VTTPPSRQSKGQPTGGQFAAQAKPEAEVSLSGDGRTRYGADELRGYRTAGHGMEGRIWTATIYRDGKAVIAITDDGNGGGLRFVDKSTGAARQSADIAKFKAQAARYFPDYAEHDLAGDLFAEDLMFSAELDKFARKNSVTLEKAVDIHIAADQIQADERDPFINPDVAPPVD
jgi:hypothetical protein